MGSNLGVGDVREIMGGWWGLLDWLNCFLRDGLSLGFGIWTGIPLFWAVAPARAVSWVNGGWFEVGFGHGRRREED